MLLLICASLSVFIGLGALALQRFYSSIPAKELKRLAARGDHLAAALYRPVAYGESMRLLLWLLFSVSLAGGLLLVSLALPAWAALAVMSVCLGAAVLTQSLRLTVRSAHLAVKAAPALNWLLTYLHAPFDVVARFMNRYRNHSPHTGLYEKEDIIQLLEQQKDQLDNRVAEHELELLTRAARFDDRQAADITQPMSRVKLVNAEEPVGPVLLADLHASNQSSFLVYEGSAEHVVGTLLLHDAVAAKAGGAVRELMRQRLCFVHEDFSLRQVLKAFTHTGQQLAVVINPFEEAVGVVTLPQLLHELLGEQPADGFDAFEDRTAVASWQPATLEPAAVPVASEDPAEEAPPEPEPQSDEAIPDESID